MSYVVATPAFKRNAKRLQKKYPSLKAEVGQLIDDLEVNPIQGAPLGKGCYKIRLAIASKNRGKSGGGRVITCVKVVHDMVFLLAIYDKAERESLDESELDALLQEAGLSPGGDAE